MTTLSERCPYCNSAITRPQLEEIRTKIRTEERTKLAKAEATMRKQFEDRYKQDLAKEMAAAETRIKADAQKTVSSMAAQHNKTVAKVRELEAREASIRQQAQADADKQVKKAADEASKRQQAEAAELRKILEKDRDRRLLKQGSEFNRERERYQKKTKELERQIQQQSANSLGDGAEIDLYEALRDAFRDDRITRVPKGELGADIIHEVRYKGEVCGKIILDSKHRQAWQNGFAKKLREDQVREKADHAILSTTVFPSGKKALCVEEGVVVASPSLVLHIAGLLRNAMVRMHTLGLSMKERAGKMASLYKFITSDGYAQRFGEASKLSVDIQELDVDETKEHQRVWKQRGHLTTRLTNVLRGLDNEISAIVEASAAREVGADERVAVSGRI